MFKRSFGASLVVAALFIGGCGLTGGTSVVKYDKNQPARMTKAPSSGMYGLYSSTDRTPKVTYELDKGDDIGFTKENGQVVAVAGEHREPITTSMLNRTYYWKKAKK